MSGRFQQLVGSKQDGPPAGVIMPSGTFAATIAEDATAMNHKVHFIFATGPQSHRHGAPARWMPRADAQIMPKRGDRCVVVIDEQSDPWILVWTPRTYG